MECRGQQNWTRIWNLELTFHRKSDEPASYQASRNKECISCDCLPEFQRDFFVANGSLTLDRILFSSFLVRSVFTNGCERHLGALNPPPAMFNVSKLPPRALGYPGLQFFCNDSAAMLAEQKGKFAKDMPGPPDTMVPSSNTNNR